MGPDAKWKDDGSPFGSFTAKEDMEIKDHGLYLSGQSYECHKGLVHVQRSIANHNKMVKAIKANGGGNKHRVGINSTTVAKMSFRNLEVMEDIQQGWKDSLRAYEYLLSDHGDLKECYDDLVDRHKQLIRQLEDLGVVPAVHYEEEPPPIDFSVQPTSQGGTPPTSRNIWGEEGGNNVDDGVDDDDETVPMSPSPVQMARSSDSPVY